MGNSLVMIAWIRIIRGCKNDMAEMDKNKENDKQVKISSDRHQELKLLSAKTGKEMREIINEAFDMYLMKYNIRD